MRRKLGRRDWRVGSVVQPKIAVVAALDGRPVRCCVLLMMWRERIVAVLREVQGGFRSVRERSVRTWAEFLPSSERCWMRAGFGHWLARGGVA